jgi:hypothetical protein
VNAELWKICLFSTAIITFITLYKQPTKIIPETCILTFLLHLPTGRIGLRPSEVNTDTVKTYMFIYIYICVCVCVCVCITA